MVALIAASVDAPKATLIALKRRCFPMLADVLVPATRRAQAEQCWRCRRENTAEQWLRSAFLRRQSSQRITKRRRPYDSNGWKNAEDQKRAQSIRLDEKPCAPIFCIWMLAARRLLGNLEYNGLERTCIYMQLKDVRPRVMPDNIETPLRSANALKVNLCVQNA